MYQRNISSSTDKLADDTIGSRIKIIRLERNLTQKEFADSLGIVQGFLSSIERNRKTPSDTLVIALCNLYGISQEWLNTGAGERQQVSAPQQRTGIKGPGATPMLKKIALHFPDQLKDEEISGYVALPGIPEGCYAIITYGDFMSPTVRDGDIVIFTPDASVENGDIVIVNNRWGEPILRRKRYKGNELFYSPDNPAYAPFKPDPETKIIGKVIDVWRKIRI